MKSIQDIKDEVTALQVALTTIQTDLQALQDAIPTTLDVPTIPQITIPLNTPVELVTG